MNEIAVITNKVNPSLHIWGWEVPVYLFLGGLTAGILIIVSLMFLGKKEKEYSFASYKIALYAPIIMSIGMGALFLDLKHKLFVWRFYTTFNITSPMSWGSWVLLLIYPLSVLLIFATIRKGYPKFNDWIEKLLSKINFVFKIYKWFLEFSEKNVRSIAAITMPFAILLGIYTGVLLSAFRARPFWNSPIMGPIFLVSGLSTAAALVILLAKDHKEKEFFTKFDLGLILTEITFLVLFIIGLTTSSAQYQKAADLILGGKLTPVFWVFVFGFALIIPAFLEILELKGKKIPSAYAALLVLIGGLILRFIIVEAGQISGWLPY